MNPETELNDYSLKIYKYLNEKGISPGFWGIKKQSVSVVLINRIQRVVEYLI